MLNIFAVPTPGHNSEAVELDDKQQVIPLRKMNHSIFDIKTIFDAKNICLCQNQIDKILKHLSHDEQLRLDQGTGLFAGLNVLPNLNKPEPKKLRLWINFQSILQQKED